MTWVCSFVFSCRQRCCHFSFDRGSASLLGARCGIDRARMPLLLSQVYYVEANETFLGTAAGWLGHDEPESGGIGLNPGIVAKEMPDPLGTEFSVFIEEVNLGLPLADALKSWKNVWPCLRSGFLIQPLWFSGKSAA